MSMAQWVWQNGKLKPWGEATVHVMAHGLHYGSSIFEGIRSYPTESGAAVFRLDDHLERLIQSCKMYRMRIPYSRRELATACCKVVDQNGLKGAYIRPLVYRDASNLSLAPSADDPIGVAVIAFDWGPLHGTQAQKGGAHVCVSSWKRLRSASNPVLAKASGHYLTSQLIASEAVNNGFDDGLAVDSDGLLTEAAGANVFLVRHGRILTPGLGSGILQGLTRDTLFHVAQREGMNICETQIPRESLYSADELFMCGTAAEITPIASVDRISIGEGRCGPITKRLQDCYQDIVRGRREIEPGWLTPTTTSTDESAQRAPQSTTSNHATTC